jgi:hypothetical protein
MVVVMSAIPTEMITLLGSSLLGTASKLISLVIESRKQEKLLQLQVMSGEAKIVDRARRYENPHFQWTRRVIALTAVFFVIAFPKIVALLSANTDIAYGYTEATPGFFGFGSVAKLNWQIVHGLAITPIDTHLLAAIIGLYFGGSLARK